ncbi:hypothetical protein IV203_012392 [Nitzschia inconspicua]|uniref:Uncharacterized protein n=1 Tax=Nitzschia inconspicua TaxID=303405 RepID=A0A9K3PJP8_9STRA|nr:hypothetical protein IV203_012392 [Nitzschia inconspicua]
MKFSSPALLLAAFLVTHQDSVSAFLPFTQQHHQSRTQHPSCISTTNLYSTAVNNVVLRPTRSSDTDDSDVDDDHVFDSLKIGGCRVHRYSGGADSIEDADVHYVMWYHGRSVKQDQDKSLPPLSTGRIGRATSKNGLVFVKDRKGSSSEDVEGVAVGLNHEAWWGFDTAHVGLGSVLLPMSTPAVMAEGGVYLMYYMGGSHEETPIGDYVDKDMPADATIKGMKMKIGVCVSQDGKTWGRVEGDDPSGACMVPYDKNDPNTREMATLKDDNNADLDLPEELYCGWPDVVVKIDKEKAANSGFFMYYSTMTKIGKEKCIAVAVSGDGFRWDKRGLCLKPSNDESSMDNAGCARCNVVQNAVYDPVECRWSDAPGYTMYYEGVSKADNKHRIMVAESDDGRTWNKKGVVLDVGDDGLWDSDGVGSPHILRMDDGSQRMYYVGQQGKDTAIGVAKLEPDSSCWVREQSSIVFAES